jgi:hypothetical protein
MSKKPQAFYYNKVKRTSNSIPPNPRPFQPQNQPFERSKPQTEIRDSHARYYAMYAGPGRKFGKTMFTDDTGRCYRIGVKQPGGLQQLDVKLPKGVDWFKNVRPGQQLVLHPKSNPGITLTPTLVYAFIGNDMTRRKGYVHVRGWLWNGDD